MKRSIHMAKKKAKAPTVIGIPGVEGVKFEYGSATACAVRNETRDITVRVRQENHFFRELVGSFPFVRGVVRLFRTFTTLFRALSETAALRPRTAIRGSSFARTFANLFRTSPLAMAAGFSAVLVPVILAVMMIALPMGAEFLLLSADALPRFAINAICCVVRVIGALLSVYMICRLRVINRLCMYRGAASKVINSCETSGPEAAHENAAISSRLTEKSDGAFAVLVMVLSIIAFAGVRIEGILLQLAFRAGTVILISGFVNEIILPLERAKSDSALAVLRRPLIALQRLFTIEPHNQMLEVALCAFRAAYENDMSRED